MQKFEEMSAKERAEFVGEIIKKQKASKQMKRAIECRDYYDTDNPDIKARRKMYAAPYGDENSFTAIAKENKFAANEKVASSFFRDITDAKVQYLAGEGLDINAVDEADVETVKVFTNALGVQLKRVEQESLTDALVYRFGYSYMQVINGRLKLNYVPFCEVVPFYDRTGQLINVLRFWSREGCEFAEYHTEAMIYCFEFNGKEWVQTEERAQIITLTVYGDGSSVVTSAKGWPRLPWFEMKHNNDGTSSLTNAAKTMIRCYDIILSDFANNLIDLQDVFISIKDTYGSGGDWSETLELLKTFKVGENIEDVRTFEVPHVARQTLLDMLQRNIYAALRGVDVGRISGGNLTNTAIRALYSDIDLWADQAQWHIDDWARDILDLAAHYLGLELPAITISLTRNMIIDEVTAADAMARQKGVISDKSLFEHHPYVADAQAELERIAAEELDAAYSAGA